MRNQWPRRLWIIRHGESMGNVARQAAMDAGLAEINIDHRDIDVPLSPLGEEQATALGKWFARHKQDGVPQVVLASPYERAHQTAELISQHGGFADAEFYLDERLREKEFGVLDRLTALGIQERYPDQVRFRTELGKFYHRPPAGESWCDVVLRLRSLLDTVGLHHAGEDVMIVAHQVVVLCLRYVIERMSEEQILAIDREGDVANCSITEYRLQEGGRRGGDLVLERYNFVAPLEEQGAEVTAEPTLVGTKL
ncbi:histidine phosphatase family protein [Devosia rhizoryzae]|uniref:Histidine phosphatase family protein n=1 Tax=Devosia rhizoryzae TaxID=2774137 RepID=A0ABX7C4I1_9HYPH|nr:histidine phosphatase family protein [Devosia rhizoryzae]QQR38657.1 histidine phosphatase family protein [Devosia rhizoryzae]